MIIFGTRISAGSLELEKGHKSMKILISVLRFTLGQHLSLKLGESLEPLGNQHFGFDFYLKLASIGSIMLAKIVLNELELTQKSY